jgi:endoglucanase
MKNQFYLLSGSLTILVYFTILSGACTSSPIEIVEMDTKPSQDTFMSAEQMNGKLGRGINLGNALEAPSEGEWGMTIEKEYFSLIKSAGFNSVRIPIRWSSHTNNDSPYTIEEDFLQRVHQVVDWALEQQLAVVINIHHFNELMDEPNMHKQKYLSIWNQVARSFMNHPEEVVFEILNEPHSNLTQDLWNNFLMDAITTVRKSNPRRVLMAGTAPWGGFDGLQFLDLSDENRQLIVTVHYYNPFHFTHQGAEWVEDNSNNWLGTTWTATTEQKQNVESDFSSVKDWANQHQRPVHVGEFGAYNKAPLESRVIWTRYIRTSAEERNFSWAYWEFGAGFGIYDRENRVWRTQLLDALTAD